MTEEIIIDCAFYKDGVCASPINKTCEYCKNIDVSKCYHKQLVRLKQQHNDDTEEIAKLRLDIAILEKHVEMLVDAINQGTKKFQYEEAPFLHDAMGKHFEFSTGLNLDDILGD